jgi:hypothetical protein
MFRGLDGKGLLYGTEITGKLFKLFILNILNTTA